MTPELVVITIVGGIVAAYGFFYRPSVSAFWNPLRMAMTLTAVFLFYGVAALFGYTVPSHLDSLRQIHSVGHVVWRQAEFGFAFGMLSIPMWWLGLKEIGRTSQ